MFDNYNKKETWSNQPLIIDLESCMTKVLRVIELNNGDLVVGTNEGDLMLWQMKKNGRFELILLAGSKRLQTEKSRAILTMLQFKFGTSSRA
jgi:hypothetical protein